MSKRKDHPGPADGDANDASEENPARFETEPGTFVDAASVLRLRFPPDEATYHPEFTHQIFDPDGALECPLAARPLSVDIVYAPTTLNVQWHATHGGSTAAASATLARLASSMPAMCEAEEPVTSMGALEALAGAACGSYTHGEGKYTVHAAQLVGAPASRVRFSERLQTLFRFSIETSSPIDHADERWRLVTIFQTPSSDSVAATKRACEFRLVGAATVFRFQRWVAGRGVVPLLRVCQIATLPPYRGAGHGARLLQAVYEHAASLGIEEITVEDPNDGCRLLRDRVDYRNACDSSLLQPEPEAFGPPSKAALNEAREALRITEDQCCRVFEMRQLAHLRQVSDDAAEDALKPLRLAVKRRLAQKHKEDLDAALSTLEHAGDGDEAAPPSREVLVAAKKARLEDMWRDLLGEYQAAIGARGAPA